MPKEPYSAARQVSALSDRADALRSAICQIWSATGAYAHEIPAMCKAAIEADEAALVLLQGSEPRQVVTLKRAKPRPPSADELEDDTYTQGLEKTIRDAEDAALAFGYPLATVYLADIIRDLGQKAQSGSDPQARQEWSAKSDAEFSRSEDFPWIVLKRHHGPCEPNVFASRMAEADAKWLAKTLNAFPAPPSAPERRQEPR